MFVVDPEGEEIFGAEPTRDAEHMRGADHYEKDDLISAMSGTHREAVRAPSGSTVQYRKERPGFKNQRRGAFAYQVK